MTLPLASRNRYTPGPSGSDLRCSARRERRPSDVGVAATATEDTSANGALGCADGHQARLHRHPVTGRRALARLLHRHARPQARRARALRVLGRRDVLRDLGARAAGHGVHAPAQCPPRPARRRRRGDADRAGGQGRRVPGRHVRHRCLPHGALPRPRRQRPDAAPPLRARRVSGLVNLFSDTQTRPSTAMRRAMVEAEVGDEQRFQDPTTLELERRVAELLGHEAAVFLPSGTMCNEIAIRLHIRPGGDELLIGRETHPLVAEAGGPAALSGAVITVLDGDAGRFDAATLEAAIEAHPAGDRYSPNPRLVCVEQPTNLWGGRVWPLAQIEAVLDVARAHGLKTHLDGARLLNATTASGDAPADVARGFDSAWLDFTKGLGAPVGAVLAGSQELIDGAWRWKQMLGGAMRQSGIVAAGGLHALDHHVERLADDHARARRLAEGLAELPGVTLDPATVETNIVVFEHADARGFAARLEAEHRVRLGALTAGIVRAVTHLDVDDDGIDRALAAARAVLAG